MTVPSSAGIGQPIFTVVRHLSDDDGSFRGIATLNISPNHLTEFWRQIVLPGNSVSLVRKDGTVLARYPNPPMAAIVLDMTVLEITLLRDCNRL